MLRLVRRAWRHGPPLVPPRALRRGRVWAHASRDELTCPCTQRVSCMSGALQACCASRPAPTRAATRCWRRARRPATWWPPSTRSPRPSAAAAAACPPRSLRCARACVCARRPARAPAGARAGRAPRGVVAGAWAARALLALRACARVLEAPFVLWPGLRGACFAERCRPGAQAGNGGPAARAGRRWRSGCRGAPASAAAMARPPAPPAAGARTERARSARPSGRRRCGAGHARPCLPSVAPAQPAAGATDTVTLHRRTSLFSRVEGLSSSNFILWAS